MMTGRCVPCIIGACAAPRARASVFLFTSDMLHDLSFAARRQFVTWHSYAYQGTVTPEGYK